MLVCKSCFQIFKEDTIKIAQALAGDKHLICPKAVCNGLLVFIDDPLVNILIDYWKIRIETLFSCSGHLWGFQMRPYVMFCCEHTGRYKTDCSTLDKFFRFHNFVRDFVSHQKKNSFYSFKVDDIDEITDIRIHPSLSPSNYHRFSLIAYELPEKDEKKKRINAIKTQGAFLELLYDIYYKMSEEDRYEKVY